MSSDFLYRGVSKKLHTENEGILLPNGTGFNKPVFYGSSIAIYDSGITYGSSPANAVIGHQSSSGNYPTSGISTTPHIERARFYALHLEDEGIIYKISRALLANFDVKEFRVSDYATQPKIPEDDEIILVADGGKSLPSGIVVEIINVNRTPGGSGKGVGGAS